MVAAVVVTMIVIEECSYHNHSGGDGDASDFGIHSGEESMYWSWFRLW